MDKLIVVKAIHAYSPTHNDELKLSKGDLITVTQKEEGWWEGTLNGVTGWFPSNYVTAVAEDAPSALLQCGTIIDSEFGNSKSPLTKKGDTLPKTSLPLVHSSPGLPSEEQLKYRQMVLNELIESETAFIHDLRQLWNNYLQHISEVETFTTAETHCLTGCLPEMLNSHDILLRNLELEHLKPLKEQRIGRVFLDYASKLEAAQKAYCENHPRASKFIDTNRKSLQRFMEVRGAADGILTLVTGLSQPFRRFEKYPSLLQQIELRVEESHKDRGDLQRSIEYFKEADKFCGTIRKQKEMELEVLYGTIVGWEGTDVAQLGEIIHMNLVHIGQDLQPRYFVLFANTLLILSYNSEQNTLSYEGKIPVSGVTLPPLSEKNKHLSTAFEIAGPMIEPILVNCISRAAKDAWITQLNRVLKASRYPSHGSLAAQSFGQLTPPVQAWSISRLRPNPPTNPLLVDSVQNNPNNGNKSTPTKGSHDSSIVGNGRLYGNGPQLTHEEDSTILSIVDAFCAANRQTSGGGSRGGFLQTKPKTLAEVVFSLRDDVTLLKTTIATLTEQLEAEQRARVAFQDFVQGHLKGALLESKRIERDTVS